MKLQTTESAVMESTDQSIDMLQALVGSDPQSTAVSNGVTGMAHGLNLFRAAWLEDLASAVGTFDAVLTGGHCRTPHGEQAAG